MNHLDIVIENHKGSYKSFEIEGDPVWKNYPLAGVTYPVDYGYINGFVSEDGHDLDVFLGTGELYGYFVMWRMDVPLETKVAVNVTKQEWAEIYDIFAPVIKEQRLFDTQEAFLRFLSDFQKKNK